MKTLWEQQGDVAPSNDSMQDGDENSAYLGKGRKQKRCVRGGSAGGAAMHLSEAAVALILELIVTGYTNAQINQELREAGHLGAGDVVSRQTLTRYRRDPRAKVQCDRLTDEAMQVGHILLSESIVQAVETAHALGAYVLSAPGVLYPYKDPKDLKLYMALQMQCWNFVWDKLGRPELLENSVEAHGKPAEDEGEVRTEHQGNQGLSELEKREIIVAVKQQFAKILRDSVMQVPTATTS